jgi:hypothetical protein
MEGPTPVSALIHAATMVTAGVYLISRSSPIFEYSEFVFCNSIDSIFFCWLQFGRKKIRKVAKF